MQWSILDILLLVVTSTYRHILGGNLLFFFANGVGRDGNGLYRDIVKPLLRFGKQDFLHTEAGEAFIA